MGSHNLLPTIYVIVLVQNQTTKKFGPFVINLPKIRSQIFSVPRNFFGPFCALRLKFLPLGNFSSFTNNSGKVRLEIVLMMGSNGLLTLSRKIFPVHS
jgi:hypothetical protein